MYYKGVQMSWSKKKVSDSKHYLKSVPVNDIKTSHDEKSVYDSESSNDE